MVKERLKAIVADEVFRGSVNSVIEDTRKSLKELDLETRIKALDHIHDTLNNDEPFQLTVVGDFSRGKSMFINALIGTDLLPSKTVPTTTFITHILHAEREDVVLEYEDDSTVTVDLKAFKSMRAPRLPNESDEEEVKKYLEEVEALSKITRTKVAYPFPNEAARLFEIVDTPGMNDMFDQREAITRGYLPSSDAILFVLSATNPISESEKAFLEGEILSRDIRNVFFILNFKDRLQSSVEEEKTRADVHEQLTGLIASKEIKLFVVSSLEALQHKLLAQGCVVRRKPKVCTSIEETGFPAFEASLKRFLDDDRVKVKATKALRRLNRMIGEIQRDELASMDVMTNEEKKRVLSSCEQECRQCHSDIQALMVEEIEAVREQEEKMVLRFNEAQKKLAVQSLARLDACSFFNTSLHVPTEKSEEAMMTAWKRYSENMTLSYLEEAREIVQASFAEVQNRLNERLTSYRGKETETKVQLLSLIRLTLMDQHLQLDGDETNRNQAEALPEPLRICGVLNEDAGDPALNGSCETRKQKAEEYMSAACSDQTKRVKEAFNDHVKQLTEHIDRAICHAHERFERRKCGMISEKPFNQIEEGLCGIQERAVAILNMYGEEESNT